MAKFRVWAPRPRRVDVVVGAEHRPMSQASDGWWEASGAEPGASYRYSLDGGPPRPDPRSAFQPEGVLGPSVVVDHGAFAWHDAAWRGRPLAGSVIYELHVGTFTGPGTFDAAIEKLPHLLELGVTAIEVMPVAEFGGDRGWGYDGAALFAPHHAYGGPDGLKRLVDACHQSGLAALLDVVYNHLGPVGNFLAEFGPYFTERYRTAWGAALNYDGRGSDEVRRFIVDNAIMWTRDYHFDGLRLDAVHAILDQSPLHILEQLATDVHAAAQSAGREVLLIAESDHNDPRLVQPADRGGYGLDGVWSDDWHHSLHAALTHETTGYYADFGSLRKVGKALRQAWVYDGVPSTYRGRTWGRKAKDVPASRFVVATQNHDQVGNRATGDRLAAQVAEGELMAAAALLLLSQFTPLLFQGEEWGASSPFQFFTDFSDPQLGAAVREGRRREFEAFGWDGAAVPDPQAIKTFEASKLRWSEIDEDGHRRLLDWHRGLLRLRGRLPVVASPVGEGVQVEIDDALRHLVYARDRVRIYLNLGDESWDITTPPGFTVALASDGGMAAEDMLRVPPHSVAVLEGGRGD